MITGFKVEGLEGLEQAFAQLTARASASMMREVLKDAAEPMRGQAEANAPIGSEEPHIREHIVIATRPAEQLGDVTIGIGPERPFFYGRLIELGTRFTAAKPWLRPAFDDRTDDAIAIFIEGAWRELAGRGISRSVTVETPIQSEGPLL